MPGAVGLAGGALAGGTPAMPGMTGIPGVGIGGGGRPAPPKSLRELAIDAFKRGDDNAGFQLLYTHFAIMPTAGEELAEKMAWNPGLRRPALGPRFAFGAIYNPPSDFESSPQPIGSKEAEEALASLTQPANEGSGSGGSGEKKSRRIGDKRRQANAGNRGGAPGGAAPGAAPNAGAIGGIPGMGGGESTGPGDGPLDELEFYTGEYGTQLNDAIQSRLASGDYGLVMRDLMTEARRPVQRRPQQNNNGAIPGALGAPPGGIGAPPGVGPMPGDLAGGNDFPPAGAGVPGIGGAAAGQGEGQADGEDQGPGLLAPAMVWLGTGRTKDELLRAAERAHADVLVAFDITVRPAKINSFVNNTTKVRVSLVKKDELLINTSGLNNRDVLQAREKGLKGDDPVEKEIARIVEALDKQFTTAELPAAITPERALARVQSLVAQKPDDPLVVVVETRFYAEKGLLKQEDVLQIAAQALGEEKFAEMLAQLPGAGAGQMIGGSVGLGGLLDLMRGVNSASDAANGSGAAGKASGGGIGGLLPFGLPIPGLAGTGKQPAGAAPAGANVPPGIGVPPGANVPPGIGAAPAGANPANVPPGIGGALPNGAAPAAAGSVGIPPGTGPAAPAAAPPAGGGALPQPGALPPPGAAAAGAPR